MIGYVTLGTADLERAGQFYDAIASEMGTARMYSWEKGIAWGEAGGAAGICAMLPFDGKPATAGNGTMVALEVKEPALVDRIYEVALANGGTDEGAPGDRGNGFYAAYFRDPDGNKLNAFVMGAESDG